MTAPALIRKADVARMVEQRAAGWYEGQARSRSGQRTLTRESGQNTAVNQSGRRWPYLPLTTPTPTIIKAA